MANRLPLICKNTLRPTFVRDTVMNSRTISSSFCTYCASLKNARSFSFNLGTTQQLLHLQSYTPSITQIREKTNWKNRGKKSSSTEYDSGSDSDEEDFVQKERAKTEGVKVVQVQLNNLRVDCVIKNAFGIARNKSEVLFYENRIRINGKKPLKKSSDTNIGDEIDIIKGISPENSDFIVVSRVEILRARPSGDYISATIRKQKNMTIENYPEDCWVEKTSEDTTEGSKEIA